MVHGVWGGVCSSSRMAIGECGTLSLVVALRRHKHRHLPLVEQVLQLYDKIGRLDMSCTLVDGLPQQLVKVLTEAEESVRPAAAPTGVHQWKRSRGLWQLASQWQCSVA